MDEKSLCSVTLSINDSIFCFKLYAQVQTGLLTQAGDVKINHIQKNKQMHHGQGGQAVCPVIRCFITR